MKTKELIRQLQEADPSGECDCCVDNADILFVQKEEAYWDGRLQVLQRDGKGHVVGIKITSNGDKVSINICPLDEAIFNYPDLPVDFDLAPSMLEDYQKHVAELREKAKKEWADAGSPEGWKKNHANKLD